MKVKTKELVSKKITIILNDKEVERLNNIKLDHYNENMINGDISLDFKTKDGKYRYDGETFKKFIEEIMGSKFREI